MTSNRTPHPACRAIAQPSDGGPAPILSVQVSDFAVAVRRALCRKLVDRPVVVVSSLRPMGRVLCLSAEAREAGLQLGHQFAFARHACPDAAFFTPDREQEARAMRVLLQTAYRICPRIEAATFGRIYLDLRGTDRLWGLPLDLAERLRRDLQTDVHLATAHGLSSRRVWSQLAGQLVAPTGVLEVLPGQEQSFLSMVPPEWVDGIGPKTSCLLRDMNITRLGQLCQFERGELVDLFGAVGGVLYHTLSPSEPEVGIATTLPENLALGPEATTPTVSCTLPLKEESAVRETIRHAVRLATQDCGRQLRAQQFHAQRVRVSLQYSDGRSASARRPLESPGNLDTLLAQASAQALQRALKRRVRLSSVTIACEGVSRASRQLRLFADSAAEREARRLRAVDAVCTRFGQGAIFSAFELAEKVS